MTNDHAPPQSTAIALKLLHASNGHALHTWNFRRQAIVRIGRAEDADVVVTDPHVSRQHAELRYVDGFWELTPLGRHGVLIQDERVEGASTRVEPGQVLQLGPGGPLLQFEELDPSRSIDSQMARTTVEFDFDRLAELGIDRAKADEEVQQITADETFRLLVERAQDMRKKYSPPSADP